MKNLGPALHYSHHCFLLLKGMGKLINSGFLQWLAASSSTFQEAHASPGPHFIQVMCPNKDSALWAKPLLITG